ncbi:unnamed protein product [Protopolystoma xenopodis]|uniref:Amidase domain-containing protein n=1 Tax=Protopolystoma xenopodis TaxID=117903 RepID=A0A448XBX2_9PLAT|nr:unnamed protein product [Protopolystoma xenopodis]
MCMTNKPAFEDCVVVKALRSAGAVPFVLTNMGQSIWRQDSWNPIFGRPLHPTHPDRMVGASSGGEAAILARRGSPLGLAVDFLGSLRFPAAFCGVSGLKPTQHRLSSCGLNTSLGSSDRLPHVVGPIGHCVDDLADMMETLCHARMFDLDPSLPRMPFNRQTFTRPFARRSLRIGYFVQLDDLPRPVPAVERALMKAKRCLELQGHELVEFRVPQAYSIVEMAFSLAHANLWPQIFRNIYASWNFDVMDRAQRIIHGFYMLPNCIASPLVCLVSGYLSASRPLLSRMLRCWRREEAQILVENRLATFRDVFFTAWTDLELDACLCPVTLCPAPRLNSLGHEDILSLLAHCALFSLTGGPAGVVPFGAVTRADEQEAEDRVGLTPAGTEARLLRQQIGSQGLPLAVQIAALPWNDEIVLHLMRQLESTAST